MSCIGAPLPGDRGPAVLPGSTQCDLVSQRTGRTYRIFVSRPDGEAPSDGYPVFIAVDGNLVFPIAVAVNAMFALAGKASLVVGVGYPTSSAMDLMSLRTRDLTPPTPLERLPQRPYLPPPKLEDYGGDEAFFAFLTEELTPLLAREYPINMADLTLYGHSWGGLFTVGAFLKHPATFKTFIASSPSIWWNDRSVLEELPGFMAKVRAAKLAPRFLLLVGAAEETIPRPIPKMILDQVAERAAWAPPMLRGWIARWFVGKMLREYRMVGNARRLATSLRHLPGEFQFHCFAREDHTTALPASIGRAFDFVHRC